MSLLDFLIRPLRGPAGPVLPNPQQYSSAAWVAASRLQAGAQNPFLIDVFFDSLRRLVEFGEHDKARAAITLLSRHINERGTPQDLARTLAHLGRWLEGGRQIGPQDRALAEGIGWARQLYNDIRPESWARLGATSPRAHEMVQKLHATARTAGDALTHYRSFTNISARALTDAGRALSRLSRQITWRAPQLWRGASAALSRIASQGRPAAAAGAGGAGALAALGLSGGTLAVIGGAVLLGIALGAAYAYISDEPADRHR